MALAWFVPAMLCKWDKACVNIKTLDMTLFSQRKKTSSHAAFNAEKLQRCSISPIQRNHCTGMQHRTRAADLVLPFKLSPHAPELHIGAAGRADVVHDVDVDVIQHHHTSVGIGCGLIHNVTKDSTSLCGRDLDVCPARELTPKM